MRTRILVAAAALTVLTAASGCGGGAANDPRCVDLCTIDEPSIEGAGEVCSQASADACRQACGAQIQGVEAACAACLLEGARFGTSESSGGAECETSPTCPEGLCTDSGWGGTCDYCMDDQSAERECYKKTHPLREIECDADFRDPADCSDLCGSK